jgi:AcrR family transcriptional regulator
MTAPSSVAAADAPQRRRGAALEDAILEAAYAELSEVGYASFTVEGVAARARTGKASIYRRWPSRGTLMLDAVCSQLPTPSECGLDVRELADGVTTADAFRAVARTIAQIIASPAGDVVRAIKCEAVTDPDLARAIDDRFQAPRRQHMLHLLRRGIARGEVRPGADTAIVADVLPAVLTHRMIMQREPVTARDITDIMEQVLLPLIEPR